MISTKEYIKSTVQKIKKEKKNKDEILLLQSKKLERIKAEAKLKQKALDLIYLFEASCFHLGSSPEKVAKVVAKESRILKFGTTIYTSNNEFLSEYITKVYDKFGVRIHFYVGGGEETWCGSGDDMTYSRDPSYVAVSFHI